jgi:hypothetical protein
MDVSPHKFVLISFLKKLSPVLVFLFVLGCQWRIYSLSHYLPAYGDGLEIVWGVSWFHEVLLQNQPYPFFHPHIFFPNGWHVLTFANGMGLFALLLPLSLLGNEAFAYNTVVLVMLAVAFAGMYQLARQFSNQFGATLAAVLFTFWGPRWIRMGGHLNVMFGSALLPWIAWGLEKAYLSKSRYRWWFSFVGIIWAIAVSFSFYFFWLAGILVFCWALGNSLNGRITKRTAVESLIIPGFIMGVVNLPLIIGFYRAKKAINATDFGFTVVNEWGANLNSLFSPFIGHTLPWMRKLATVIYTSHIDETSTVNLGLLASLAFIAALIIALRRKQQAWLPLILLVLLGLVLSLGPTLRWNKEPVELAFFEPVNKNLWQIGHQLKPSIFREVEVPDNIRRAVPLPGFLLTAVLPFWEGARVSARFVFPASVGFFLLIALVISQLQHWGWRLILTALLLLELWPKPVSGVLFPPTPHPAFAWLHMQEIDKGILDLHSLLPDKLIPQVGGETIWATRIHETSIVSGAGSIWPAEFTFLMEWFYRHAHPFLEPELVEVLRYYQIQYLLLHIKRPAQMRFVENAANNEGFSLINCFEPAPNASLWNYPICIVEVMPFPQPNFNILPQAGWSPLEPWGRWAMGKQSIARWLGTAQKETVVNLTAFPYCIPDHFQILEIVVQGEVLLTHTWSDCEPWDGQLVIPAAQVHIGWNELELNYNYAVQPATVTSYANPDSRYLSVGFTQFRLEN